MIRKILLLILIKIHFGDSYLYLNIDLTLMELKTDYLRYLAHFHGFKHITSFY